MGIFSTRPSSCLLLLGLLSCSHGTTSTAHAPGAAPAETAGRPPPAWASQLSSNCQAPLAFTEEVTRLLVKAAAHATHSGACYDGSGTRVTVDRVLVCPSREDKEQVTLYARYDVTSTGEGDTRI